MNRIFLDTPVPLTQEQAAERAKYTTYSRSKCYINRLPGTVYIKERSGLITELKDLSKLGTAYQADYLYIVDTLNGDPDIFKRYSEQARLMSSHMRTYLMTLLLTDRTKPSPGNSHYTATAVSKISLGELKANNSVVYLEEHDVVLMHGMTYQQALKVEHPYTSAGYACRVHDLVNEKAIFAGDFHFNISIIDNNKVFGNKWIMVGPKPVRIVARESIDIVDGIYFSFNRNNFEQVELCEALADRYDFKDRDNLPYYTLYDSESDALESLNIASANEAAIKLAEAEAKRSVAETNLRKAQQEKENQERDSNYKQQEADARQRRFEQETEKLERDNEKLRKDHEYFIEKNRLDNEAMLRKNTADIFKYVPMVLSAVACVVTLFAKKQ